MPVKRAEARVLLPKQLHKEENTQPSRKLVQGRSKWRSVSRSPRLPGGRFGTATRPLRSAGTEEREISRTVRGDVSTVRLHRSSFSEITRLATKGHILFSNVPGRERPSMQRVPKMPQLQQSYWHEYLTKSGNPRAHVQKSGPALLFLPGTVSSLRRSRCGGKSINTRPAWHTAQREGVPDYRRPER